MANTGINNGNDNKTGWINSKKSHFDTSNINCLLPKSISNL